MRIALLAPFEEAVPPEKYGGTELIVYYLARGLSKKGYKIHLLATGDSAAIPGVNLIPMFPRAIRKEKIAQDPGMREMLKYIGIARVVRTLKKLKVELIHDHISWRFLSFAPLFSKPTLTTLHGPLTDKRRTFVYQELKHFPYVSISNAQRRPFPELNYIATVYNGIDITQLQFNDRPEDYFAFLGRMSPEKGPLPAILAAKAAGVKLKMAAKIDAVDVQYFEKEVKPLIDGKQIEFIGEIGPEQKSDFLKNARGLIAPIQWEEPFGLFFIEAMATGAPVIAFKRGSVPEVVIDGKTGFVVEPWDKNEETNIAGLAEAVRKINQLDRAACRQHVEQNFTAEQMVANYEKVYQKVLGAS